MALDPNIALQVRPIELPNQLAQYGQLAAIQNAQNQNALAQYQLGAAKRGEETQNVLARAYAQSVDPTTGKIDYSKLTSLVASGGGGAQLPGIEKTRRETESAALTQQKLQGDVIKQRMELSKQGLENVRTPEEYLAWHEANHRDPVLSDYLASRGVTADTSRANIVKKLNEPGGFEQLMRGSALGLEKSMEQHFAEQNLGGTTRTIATPKYAMPGAPSAAAVVPGSEAAKTMTQYEKGRLGLEGQRVGLEGQRVGLESRRLGVAESEAARKAAGGDLKPVPVHAQKAITGAASSIGKLTDAIDLVSGLEVAGEKGSKTATGLKGYTPDIALNRLDPKGTVTRAAIADIGSMIMHDRSGAAVTASESPRLKPFIPLITDSVDTVKKKLERLRQIQLDDAEALAGTYNPEQGYKPFNVPVKGGKSAAPVAPRIAPPAGFTQD